MFAAWKWDKVFTINNKNYSNLFSGSGFMSKRVSVSAIIFKQFSELGVRVNLVVRGETLPSFIFILDSNACEFPCQRMNLPVCGSNHEMFSNECELRRGACKQKKAIIEVRRAKSRDDDCSCKSNSFNFLKL